MSNYEIERQAEQFKALGHPHRLAIFRRLLSCCAPGTVCDLEVASRIHVGELGEGLAIAPSTLSHHLKQLNRAGLVAMRRNGKRIECWVEPALAEQLAGLFRPAANSHQTNQGYCNECR